MPSTKSSNYEALIFDCDGVLVNSEAIVDRVLREHLSQIGLHYSQETFTQQLMGLTREASDRVYIAEAKRLGIAPPNADFYNRARAEILAAFEHELIAVAGAHRLVSRWGGPQAVASSSVADALSLKLEMTGLIELFNSHVYSADAVAQGKPDPAIFLYAAEKLQVPPDRCLAIEDSINGVTSARAAGMTVFGFTGGGHCLPGHEQVLKDAGADLVFASHAAIAEYLALDT